MIIIQNYINGKLVPPTSEKYLKNVCPSTGENYSLIPNSDETDVNQAVEAAQKSFKSWSIIPKQERSDILMHLAGAIEAHGEELAIAESRASGKPEWLARTVDIPRASENFRFFATAILHYGSEIHEMDGKAINYTLRQPIGVAGCISPWNLPLYLLTWKVAPALAAGNTVVAKPSEITPMSAYLFGKICQKAGLPKGVINIVHGMGEKVGDCLTRHPDVPIISFTGGTETGGKIASATAPLFKKLSLEMGGKNPNIIFSDAKFDHAVDMAVKASFTNQGQICLSGSRLFVQRDIYDEFQSAFIEKTRELVVGDPKDKNSNLGAVVSKEHMEKILSKIKQAEGEGGTILTGGNRLQLNGILKNGYYIEPTIIDGLPADCKTNHEEIFGPVVTMIPFTSEEEVISMANSTRYGLSASLFTSDVSRAHRVAAAIDSGVIWVNTWMLRDLRIPFGGMKSSGVGREGGFNSLEFFTESKNVCLKL